MQIVGCWPTATSENASSLEELLEKPLITGASVSADYGTTSPGRRLSLRHTTEKEIKTIAFAGTAGKDIEPRIQDEMLTDRTLIIAMDLFFWDSTFASTQKSEEAIDRLIVKAEKSATPIVLGDIPELLPGRQPSRNALNAKLRGACASYNRCAILELDELCRRIRREGSLEIKAKRYSFSELVPDGLHLSPIAADYLADFIRDRLPNGG